MLFLWLLYYAPMLQQTLVLISCRLTYAYYCLFPLMHVNRATKIGAKHFRLITSMMVSPLLQLPFMQLPCFSSYHNHISICAHLGLPVFPSISLLQLPRFLSYHKHICNCAHLSLPILPSMRQSCSYLPRVGVSNHRLVNL